MYKRAQADKSLRDELAAFSFYRQITSQTGVDASIKNKQAYVTANQVVEKYGTTTTGKVLKMLLDTWPAAWK